MLLSDNRIMHMAAFAIGIKFKKKFDLLI